jgi:rare lipoprotein A
MRPNHTRAGALAGLLGFAFIYATDLPSMASAQTPGSTHTMRIADRSLTVGHAARVRGSAGRSYAGHTAVLEFRAAGSAEWSPLASATVGDDGRYRVNHSVPRNGSLRVSVQGPPGTATAAAAQSAVRSVRVAPSVRIPRKRLHVKAGRSTVVGGVVKPRSAGIRVALQVRGARGWRTLDRDRTNARGRFALRDRQHATLSARARVVVPGHAGLAAARRGLGRLNVYRYAHASWYGPGLYGGHLACGGTLTPGTLGVANKSLPCGAKVTLRHGGRSIRVRVIDRGPYVGGREYDLTEATARRIGFHGHGALLVTR